MERSRGSARRALRGIAWLLPDGGPFSVPGADIMGVFPFALGTFGVEVGLACMPIGVDMAGKVAISGAAGMAISATQRAQRPGWMGRSQDTVVLEAGVVRVGGAGRRRRAQAQISDGDGRDGCGSAGARVGGDWSGRFGGDASTVSTVREHAV